MFNQFLPQTADNTYRGYKVALWIFAFVVLFKALIAAGCIFNGYSAASNADGIPLATFPPGAVQTILSDFAIWGLAFLMICFLCALVLVRYRSLVPLMFAILLTEHLARKVILYFIPVATSGTPPGFFINLALILLMVTGLALSLVNRQPAVRTAH